MSAPPCYSFCLAPSVFFRIHAHAWTPRWVLDVTEATLRRRTGKPGGQARGGRRPRRRTRRSRSAPRASDCDRSQTKGGKGLSVLQCDSPRESRGFVALVEVCALIRRIRAPSVLIRALVLILVAANHRRSFHRP